MKAALMIFYLAEGEKSVSELEDLLACVSRPFRSSSRACARMDLVTTRRDGKAIYYRLASDEARTVIGAIFTTSFAAKFASDRENTAVGCHYGDGTG